MILNMLKLSFKVKVMVMLLFIPGMCAKRSWVKTYRYHVSKTTKNIQYSSTPLYFISVVNTNRQV